MRTKKKRLTAILLSICLLCGLMPGMGTVAYAQGTGAIRPGADSIKKGDTVYFGKGERAWQVLSTNGNGGTYSDGETTVDSNSALFLLSQDGLMQLWFDDSESMSNNYSDSVLRSYLNNTNVKINGGVLEPNSGNVSEYFSDAEWEKILKTTKNAASTEILGMDCDDPGLNGDLLFALSANELKDYLGYTDDSNTWKAAGLGDKAWWLRSAVTDTTETVGAVHNLGNRIPVISRSRNVWARPAFNLNLDSVLFTSADEGGKSSSDVVGEISEIQSYVDSDTGNAWKLTLKDNSRNSFSVGTTSAENNKLTVAYSGAITGTNEYISVMATDDSGAYTHYGRVAQLEAEEQSSGAVEIDLTGIDMTGKKLYIFNEQYNGDKMTDFASELKEVSLTKNAYAIINSLTNVNTDNPIHVNFH